MVGNGQMTLLGVGYLIDLVSLDLERPALYCQEQPTPWGEGASGPKQVSAKLLGVFISMRGKSKPMHVYLAMPQS